MITNLINGKFYVGKHMTEDLNDGYMGSGKLLNRAIRKYGTENFRKDILEVYSTNHEMNLAEKILVVIDPEVSYNLCSGGKGGWGYVNEKGLGVPNFTSENAAKYVKRSRAAKALLMQTPEYAQRVSANLSRSLKGQQSFLGKKHTPETRERMSISHKDKHNGPKNSQFGTFWITNGSENTKLESGETIPDGWSRGRRV